MALKFTSLALILIAAGLSNCTVPKVPAQPDAPSETAKECAARGGTLQKIGRAGFPGCVISYPDAGKSCRSGSECAGDCRLAPDPDRRIIQPDEQVAGVCQANNAPFGCFATVENGVIDRPMMCVD